MIMSSRITTNITHPEIYQRLQVNSEQLEEFCQSNFIAELAVLILIPLLVLINRV